MEQLLQLFTEAGTLMLAGMIFVFAFLGLLVVFIKVVLSPLANRYPDPKPTIKNTAKQVRAKQGIEPGVVAAVSAAVAQYRNNITK
jgi:oxaloacetate decarboxylase gamma subunit